MKRVAVLSDVHGNSVALAAVLAELLPYEGRPGAYWALLGPDVEPRRTEYDVDGAVARYRATDFPGVEELVELMLSPPEPREVIDDAERVVFSG